MVWRGFLRCGVVRCRVVYVAWFGTVWRAVAWLGMVWWTVAWCGVVRRGLYDVCWGMGCCGVLCLIRVFGVAQVAGQRVQGGVEGPDRVPNYLLRPLLHLPLCPWGGGTQVST